MPDTLTIAMKLLTALYVQGLVNAATYKNAMAKYA